MTNEKMKAMVATGYGNHEVLQLKEVNKPTPASNELLVKVMTSAATTADTMMLTGKPYFARLFIGLTKPRTPIPGTGFSGVVESMGREVKNFNIGDKVFGETTFRFSANAEYLLIGEDGVIIQLPANLDFSEAANFCDGPLTSYNFLKEIANVQPGQSVLIIGASGALGTAGIQIANYLGASVTAVCSGKNSGFVKSLGADHVIDYTKEDYTKSEKKYDFIYDAIGKSSFKKCEPILKKKGVYLSPVLKFSLLLQVIKTSIFGGKKAKFDATGAKPEANLRSMLMNVVEIFKAGKLKMIIDRQYPLEKLGEAHRYIASGRKKGNVVIQHA